MQPGALNPPASASPWRPVPAPHGAVSGVRQSCSNTFRQETARTDRRVTYSSWLLLATAAFIPGMRFGQASVFSRRSSRYDRQKVAHRITGALRLVYRNFNMPAQRRGQRPGRPGRAPGGVLRREGLPVGVVPAAARRGRPGLKSRFCWRAAGVSVGAHQPARVGGVASPAVRNCLIRWP